MGTSTFHHVQPQKSYDHTWLLLYLRLRTLSYSELTFPHIDTTLTYMTFTSQATHDQDHAWFAVRVACRTCGGQRLDHVQQNVVECSDCHTTQWYTLNLRSEEDLAAESKSPGILKQLLIQLGIPQLAYIRHIPKATRFFWFKCLQCKKTTTDYSHGYSGYFICQFCKSKNLL
jgi:hypothetical protein